MRNPYEVLGVPKDADEATIKKAARRASSRAHPDRNGGSQEAQDLQTEINQAKDLLLDPELRSEFDRTGTISKNQTMIDKVHELLAVVIGQVAINEEEENLVHSVEQALLKADREAEGKELEFLAHKELLDRRLERLSFKGTGLDRVRTILEAQLEKTTSLVEQVRTFRKVLAASRELMKEYISTELIKPKYNQQDLNPFGIAHRQHADDIFQNLFGRRF